MENKHLETSALYFRLAPLFALNGLLTYRYLFLDLLAVNLLFLCECIAGNLMLVAGAFHLVRFIIGTIKPKKHKK